MESKYISQISDKKILNYFRLKKRPGYFVVVDHEGRDKVLTVTLINSKTQNRTTLYITDYEIIQLSQNENDKITEEEKVEFYNHFFARYKDYNQDWINFHTERENLYFKEGNYKEVYPHYNKVLFDHQSRLADISRGIIVQNSDLEFSK